MHPIQGEVCLFTYEDSDVNEALYEDFIPLDRQAEPRERH